MEIKDLVDYLRGYDGREITIMEVCGSHTAAIAKNGIKNILSDKIKLVSGPGCPVCVTPSAYIDKLIELSLEPDTTVLTFGDLIRVPGSKESLGQAKTRGAKVEMVYSPMDAIARAK
ncbi:MAG: hydrogenase formation protein HypD, partial [Pseudobutyrivibrio sp.]|nr:hydrogenase formation protein HypD [Pseudobutyrivibrio sp.]